MNPVKTSIILRVPAKINLSLDIVGRKENGYHLLEMVMQSIGLYDTLTLTLFPAEEYAVRITCDRPGIPTDSRNIVCKAAAAFFGKELPKLTLAIDIHKEIPEQAGMAGGSADAAGVLIGLNELFHRPYTLAQLCECGLMVGADVPYCIHGGTAFVSGIGENIRPLRQLKDGYIVGARPKVGISTKAAYQSFDDAHPGAVSLPSSPKTAEMLAAVEAGDLSRIAKGLFNVFEDTCAVEEVEALKRQLLDCGALGAVMTGSGSAVYGIFDAADGSGTIHPAAQNAYELLKKTQPDAFFAAISGNVAQID